MSHKWQLSGKTRDALTEAANSLTAAKEETEKAHKLVSDEVDDHRSEIDSRSERWQEGDTGLAVAEWVDAMEAMSDALDNAGDDLDTTIEALDDYEPAANT